MKKATERTRRNTYFLCGQWATQWWGLWLIRGVFKHFQFLASDKEQCVSTSPNAVCVSGRWSDRDTTTSAEQQAVTLCTSGYRTYRFWLLFVSFALSPLSFNHCPIAWLNSGSRCLEKSSSSDVHQLLLSTSGYWLTHHVTGYTFLDNKKGCLLVKSLTSDPKYHSFYTQKGRMLSPVSYKVVLKSDRLNVGCLLPARPLKSLTWKRTTQKRKRTM